MSNLEKMKQSFITLEEVKEYLQLSDDDSDDKLLKLVIIPSAIAYVKSYTGIDSIEECDDIKVAILLLCSDMFDNRSGLVSQNLKQNVVLKSILDLHSVNYL